ncbi:MAG: ribonuclease Z [Firmicutes bacterium]|nr:ribonuclease Z [Bacillota bacterium]
MFDITLSGCGGTIPLKNRWLTSCHMRYEGKCVLIDCGEGTQIAMKKASLPFKPIGIICITHFHADHIGGLPGLLLSLGGEGRTEPVTIIGPSYIEKYVKSLLIIAPELPFEIKYHPIFSKTDTVEIDGFEITAFRVNHTVACYGYKIHIPRAGRFDPELARANGVPLAVWSKLQKTGSAELDGISYTQSLVMGAPRRGITAVYCTDTRPVPIIAEMANDADIFICEGMYGDDEKMSRAIKSKHMTFSEAAELAARANPRRFWLTHYSPSMPDPMHYLSEARAIYPPTVCGYDGIAETIKFDEE